MDVVVECDARGWLGGKASMASWMAASGMASKTSLKGWLVVRSCGWERVASGCG